LARCLIIGCGCRGRLLAASLVERGHLVRGTTRDPDAVGAIAGVGAEPVLADPDRVATLVEALDHVSVVCVLLGSARGTSDQLAALHGTRLEMLLTKVVDTTARGVVYEAAGSVEPDVLRQGAERVRAFGERSLAQVELIEAGPGDHDAWLDAAAGAVEAVL
jgi:3-hydroxyisobutyrate dehydrogenase-like beta-hydroxyacid dehydrogenase